MSGFPSESTNNLAKLPLILQMERTVELDRTASILKDLEILFGLPVRTGYPSPKPLERLGLYMKDMYLEEDEDEDAILNGEEGEILS